MNPAFVPRIDRIALRTDSARVDPTTGYLHVDGTSSVVGVLEYTLADGAPEEPWFEFVPLSTLSDPKFLAAMGTIPVTIGHPSVMLDASNTKDYQVGWVQRAWMDGDRLRVSMVVTDAKAIEQIRSGLDQLSLGYHVRLEEKPGTFRGQNYKVVQAERLPNHQAFVDLARAGPGATIDRLDAASVGAWAPRMDALRVTRRQDQTNMDEVEVEIGGVRYKVPQAVAGALNAANEKLAGQGSGTPATGDADPPAPPKEGEASQTEDKGNHRSEDEGKRGDSVTRAELDSTLEAFGTSFLDKLDKRQAKLDKAATVRAELVADAKPVLANSYKFDGKTNAEIMLDAIVEAQPDLKPAAEAIRGDEAALGGMFKGALAMGKRDSATGHKINNDAGSGDIVAAARNRQQKRRDAASNGTVTNIAEARKRNAAVGEEK